MPRILILLLLLAVALLVHSEARKERARAVDIRRDTFGFSATSPSDYAWDEILQGCSHRDCIPAIDRPKFVSADQAKFLRADDLVIAIASDGEARAYPIRILVRHELVNDVFAETPIVVSYCPLCGSGLVFERSLDGEAVEFGVSGLLHNSDLIMYDRETESLWQQITGTAFAGKKRGQSLVAFPSAMTSWSQWRAAHPGTMVLSTNTGHAGYSYTRSPNGDYAQSDELMFPVSVMDARRHPKMEVFGVDIEGHPVAYDLTYLSRVKTLTDEVGGRTVQIDYGEDGMITVSGGQPDKRWIGHRMFWFAWYSFHPDTLLRDGSDLPKSVR